MKGHADPADSRHEYERRIHRVMAHIDAHLDEALALDSLAAVANFSPFHFHRLFSAWTGETLGDHLRRRRVETAAMRLAAQPKLQVLDAALGVGFGSGEAFARAFKLHFGESPSAWRHKQCNQRNQRKPDQALRNHGQAQRVDALDHEVLATQSVEDSMNVKVIDREATPVAYFRYTGPFGSPLEQFWMHKVAPWMVENQLMGRVRYGVSHDEPGVTDAAKCRYDACVELPPGVVVSGQPLRTVLPGGRYACMRFEGTSQDIDAAWQRLLRNWLPDSGLQLDARPCLEHYPQDAAFDPRTGVFDCNLCIPVKPL